MTTLLNIIDHSNYRDECTQLKESWLTLTTEAITARLEITILIWEIFSSTATARYRISEKIAVDLASGPVLMKLGK